MIESFLLMLFDHFINVELRGELCLTLACMSEYGKGPMGFVMNDQPEGQALILRLLPDKGRFLRLSPLGIPWGICCEGGV